MEGQELIVYQGRQALSLTARDVAAMGFRHRKAVVICFFAVLIGTALTVAFLPNYEAHSEILVRRQRVDPVVTAEQGNPVISNTVVTEEELNSEVELIKSDDVLRQVVINTGLDKREVSKMLFWQRKPEEAIAKALGKLKGGVRVEAVPKTDVIKVTYGSTSPRLAFQVMSALDTAYLEKHKEVHNPAGQFAFFDKQAEQAKVDLAAAEDKLRAYPRLTGTPNAALARDTALQKVNDFNFTLGQTQTEMAETQKRITALDQLAKSTAPRLTTQERKSEDAGTIQQMKTTLLNLQLKQSDMATKYQADYPPLVELNKEIAQTQAAIDANKPLNDVTTDQNPSYTWISDELVKDKAQLQGDGAKAAELQTVINQNMDAVRRLEASSIDQQDLARGVKEAEDNYLLYTRKREEARITDALDTTQLVNVAIQEKPAVPIYPAQSPLLFVALGTLLALTASAGLVFIMERMDASFRTPNEVESILNLPVLAAVPDTGNGYYSLNGNGASSRHLPVDVLRETRN